mmetsp:Transcript_35096/g.91056  ORF Transcript_35096/g.91056 Transcript_35096/m.91056 type:complete len:235 (-) Transcript_35096:310-1014(-)
MVEEGTSVSVPACFRALEGIAKSMDGSTRLVYRFIYLPNLLDTNTVSGSGTVSPEVKLGHRFLAERSTAALSKHSLLCNKLRTWLKAIFRLSILANAQIASHHTLHTSIFVEKKTRSTESGNNVHSHFLGLFSHPTAKLTQTNDVVAMVVESGNVGKRHASTTLCQKHHLIVRYWRVQRGTLLFPVWDQLIESARLEHVSTQNVCPHFGTLLQYADFELFSCLLGKLLQPDGGR